MQIDEVGRAVGLRRLLHKEREEDTKHDKVKHTFIPDPRLSAEMK